MGTGKEGAVEAPAGSSTDWKSPSEMVLKLAASRVLLGATWTIPSGVLTLTLKLFSAQLLITLISRLFKMYSIMFSCIQLFATPWTVAYQAPLPSKHLILCRPLLLLPSVFPSIRVFYSEWALCIRWPKYWCFSFSISPSKEYSGLICFTFSWLYLSESHCCRPFSALASDPSGGVWSHFPSVAVSLSSLLPSCLFPALTSPT